MSSTKSWQYLSLGCATLLLTFSTLTCALLLTAQWWGPSIGWHDPIFVCAGFTTPPGPVYIGLGWTFHWYSVRSSVYFDYGLCQFVPWPPFFPAYGRLVFPP